MLGEFFSKYKMKIFQYILIYLVQYFGKDCAGMLKANAISKYL
jgi:hypothetical protein